MSTKEQKLQKTMHRAMDAFWEQVAVAYPDVKNGDLSIDETFIFENACESAIRSWLVWNALSKSET